MLLLNAKNIKKSFSGETLFEDVSLKIYDDDKIGFVGVNGAGKSTLFKILADIIDYDSGDIFKDSSLKLGYLEQHPIYEDSLTINEFMLSIYQDVIDIENQLDVINNKILSNKDNVDDLIAKQHELQEYFEKNDGLVYKSKIKGVLMGLGFKEEELSFPINILSGGQKTRLALSKILLTKSNLLLLDEPTNHLDIESIEWLEGYLKSYKGAFVVISHDRYFLDRITNKTFDLRFGKLNCYDGNYSAYIAQHELEEMSIERNYDRTIREIHRLEDVVEQQRVWKHKKNKKTHTLDNTKKAIERLENSLVEPEKDQDKIVFHFKACPGGAKHVLITEDLGMQFDNNKLFENVNMDIKKGEKVFLLGPNGCGKTTLIKILMNKLSQSEGKYKVGDNVLVGYYDQLRENLHREKTVINEIWDDHPELTQTEVRNALALFLFRGDDAFKVVGTLSGGELARLELAKLLLDKVNLLIMDEPTNHLDIFSREALEKTLTEYDGTLFMVSHDRYFINKIANRILYLTPNGLKEFDGNYDSYLEHKKNNVANIDIKEAPQAKNNEYLDKKKSQSDRRKIVSRIAKLEKMIDEKEKEISVLEKELESPEIAESFQKLSEVSTKLEEARKLLNDYLNEWETLNLSIEE